MKRLILFSLILFSCKTPEEKAIEAVKTYVKQNLKDPSSYQPGEFKVEQLMKPSPHYEKATDSLKTLQDQGKLSMDDYIKQTEVLSKKYEEEMNNGWQIIHAYRAKNSFNALVPGEAIFHVNPDYTVSIEK